ncbi:MAG: penicillin acylase family protein, partial [Chitinophagaceae bacterium]
IRLPATMDIKALEEWYRMNKAKNFTEFYQAVSMTSLPMFNITYADRYDTIFYISNGKMPRRNPDTSYHWKSTIPGNSSATLWTEFKGLMSCRSISILLQVICSIQTILRFWQPG